ncbi:MAG: hypothetical protein LBM27_03170 [Lactobacillaceae bacterium]|jgi:hypothetical protein|nr:hypothetical protein [Lactobacillaceae bacterium]
MDKEFLNIIVHIYSDGNTQVIATRRSENTQMDPQKVADDYVASLPEGKLPVGDQIAMRLVPVDQIVGDTPEWLCKTINANAEILIQG